MNNPSYLHKLGQHLCQLVIRLTLFSASHPVLVTLTLLGITLAGGLTSRSLDISTSTSAMLSPELEFQRIYRDFRSSIPSLTNNIVIAIKSPNADIGQDATDTLMTKLAQPHPAIREVFAGQDDPFFQRNGLLYISAQELDDLSDRMAEAQPILGAIIDDQSLRGFFTALKTMIDNVDDDKSDQVDDLLVSITKTINVISQAEMSNNSDFNNGLTKNTNPRSFSWNRLLNPDQELGYHFIFVQPVLDQDQFTPAAKAIAYLRQIINDTKEQYGPSLSIRLTGGVVLEEEEIASVFSSVQSAALLSLLLVSILVFWGLRSPALISATLITLVCGLIATFGLTALSVGRLNLISVAFSVLYIGISVDFAIQFCLRLREEYNQKSHQPLDALHRSARAMASPILLAGGAAILGFLSFLPTEYLGLAELGKIAAGGIVVALIYNFTLLPALIALLTHRHKILPAPSHTWKLSQTTGLTLCVAVLALNAMAVKDLRFDFDPINLKDPRTESVRTARDIWSNSLVSEYAAMALVPSQDKATIVHNLTELDTVSSVHSLDDLIPNDLDQRLAVIDDTRLYILPMLALAEDRPPLDAEKRLIAIHDLDRYLQSYVLNNPSKALENSAFNLLISLQELPKNDLSTALLQADLLAGMPGRLARLERSLQPDTNLVLAPHIERRYRSDDGRSLLIIYPQSQVLGWPELRAFIDDIRTLAPNATDTPVVIYEAAKAVTTAFWQAAILAIILCLLLVHSVLQCWRDSLLVFVPLLSAAIASAGTAAMLGLALNFANIIALPLLFSLGISYGIYLVNRWRQQHGGIDRSSTPRAIFFSAATTMTSFGSLIIAHHQGTSSMGTLLMIAIGYTLLFTLVLLPILLDYQANPNRQHKP